MAELLNDGTFQVVGDSISESPNPTKVPHAGAVAGDDAAAAPTQPQPAPSGPQQAAPAPSLMEVGVDELEEMPSYANGLSPDSPLNTSPLDILDRFKLSAGNKVGKLQYLKAKYQDATMDKAGRFLVQKDDSWYRVDPDGLGSGDAWEMSKELGKDIADRVFTGVQGVAMAGRSGPATAAIAALANAGASDGIDMLLESMPEDDVGIKKALAAMGITAATPMIVQGIRQIKANPMALKNLGKGGLAFGATEAVRTSLGRAFGTYEATPGEQLQDIGFETLLGMGGQIIGLGTKPSYAMLKEAAAKVSDTMGTAGKDVLSSLMSVSLKEPKWAMRRALDSPGTLDRAKEAVRAIPRGSDPSEALDFIQGKQNDILRTFAKDASEGLQKEYRSNLNELLQATPETFSADVGKIASNAQVELANAGYGKIVPISGGKSQFKMLDETEIANMIGAPADQLPKIIGPKTQQALQEVTGILNRYAKLGTLSGKQGAQKTIELKRAIRESFDDIIGPDTPASIKQVVLGVKNNLDEGIGQTFADHGVADPFVKMNNAFAEKRDAVTMLTSAVNSRNPQEVDNVVKRLASKSGQYKSLKDEAKALASIAGPNGQAAMQTILDWEASKSFLSFAPKSLEGSSVGLVGRGLGLVTQQSNPRMVAQEIRAARYGAKGLDFIKGLGPKQLDAFLANDQAVGAWASSIASGISNEQQDTEALLQQAGIPPQGQGGQ